MAWDWSYFTRWSNTLMNISLIHSSKLRQTISTLLSWDQGHLVAGVGKALWIYEMGKKKLLRKVENKVSIHHHVNSLCSHLHFRHLQRRACPWLTHICICLALAILRQRFHAKLGWNTNIPTRWVRVHTREIAHVLQALRSSIKNYSITERSLQITTW